MVVPALIWPHLIRHQCFSTRQQYNLLPLTCAHWRSQLQLYQISLHCKNSGSLIDFDPMFKIRISALASLDTNPFFWIPTSLQSKNLFFPLVSQFPCFRLKDFPTYYFLNFLIIYVPVIFINNDPKALLICKQMQHSIFLPSSLWTKQTIKQDL